MKVRVTQPVFAEAASTLVNAANKHAETILIKKGDWVVDAKSLLGVLALSLQPDQEIDISFPEDNTDIENTLIQSGLFEKVTV
ncbi:HPr family phosphocarrier protein [Bacillaceae bacterium SIJ1]|uniref:HPr family phosphocarrier protein n=1 Tax=Litoribacterium kuwaitense TaxID=1398745 RepID=UPI0013ECFDA7|nr:HPr family phosphocarrier protein [Litoribacterium kuwaitense]NGP43636.1 HPr family phosphocarrier protein [Litoribacterium kuwaitense]